MSVILLLVLVSAAAVIDAKNYRIPDWITLPGIVIALGMAVFHDLFGGVVLANTPGLLEAASSSVVATISFFAVWVVTKRRLGLGDIKLAAMIAAFLGFWPWVLSMVWGLIGAVLFFVVVKCVGGEVPDRIPFGPFLALGAITTVVNLGLLL